MMLNYASATLFQIPSTFPRPLELRRGGQTQFGSKRRFRFAEAVGQLILNPVECTPPTWEDAERWDGLS